MPSRISLHHLLGPKLLLLVATLTACATIAHVAGVNFSEQEELALARQQALVYEDSAALWEDPLLERYLTDMLHRLVAASEDAPPYDYRIRVVTDPAVNAFTFGAGFIYVHGGLLARMENEAQVATVLAHELAHVTQHDVVDGFEEAVGAQILSQVGFQVLDETGLVSPEILELAYPFTMSAMINGMGRSRESRADGLGLQYMAAAGYDPHEAAHTFEILLKEYGDPPPIVTFFWGNHPSNSSRIEKLSETAAYAYADVTTGVVNTEEYKRRTRELVVATGVLDFESQRYNTAADLFDRARRVYEDDPVAHYYLGRIALETGGAGDLDRALAHFEKASEVGEDYAPAFRELGLAHYSKGNTQEAIVSLERYLKLAPGADDAARIRQAVRELRRP